MKKYYFKIGICAFLLFANACQKADKQENVVRKKEVKSPSEEITNAPKPQTDVNQKEAQPFITSSGDLFMPLERQGSVATQNASKFENVKTAAVLESVEQTQSETFLVKNEEPQQIDLKEGTKIYVPDNAFVLAETGELVTGEVKIEAKEVRDVAECLKMGVTTMSNAGLLESGGMLYVGATYEGKKCELQQGKELTVEMPSWGKKKEGMKLFTGAKKADGKVEWQEMPETQVEIAQPENPWKKYNCNTYQQKIDSIEEYIVKNQMSLADLKMGFKNIQIKVLPNNNITKADENLNPPKKYFQFTGKPITRLAKMPNATYKVIKDTFHLYANVSKISRDGKMLKWEIKENASPAYSTSVDYGNVFYSQLIGALKKRKWSKTGTVELALYLPKKYIAKLREKFPNCKEVAGFQQKYKAEYTDYFQRASEQNKAAAQRSNPEVCEKYQKLMLKAEAERKELDKVSAYYFRTKRLGWINCDRFNQDRKTEMALNLGEYEDANVTIVYKEINSIMSHYLLSLENKFSEIDQMHETHISSYETLKNIPVGYDVALFVVKKMNGKMYCALKNTNTSLKQHGNFDFEELTTEIVEKMSKKMAGKA